MDKIGLDYDIGDDVRGTGYDALLWSKEMVLTIGFTPSKIFLHISNTATSRMMLAVN